MTSDQPPENGMFQLLVQQLDLWSLGGRMNKWTEDEFNSFVNKLEGLFVEFHMEVHPAKGVPCDWDCGVIEFIKWVKRRVR